MARGPHYAACMSMLTPPGMGGKYRITGDKYPHMRRPRKRGRLVAVIVASAAVLGLLGWGSLQLFDVFSGGGTAKAADGPQHCARPSAEPARVAKLPEPKSVKVNVLNATTRSGLAKETADELKKRGFTIGEVGNAPAAYDKKVKTAGLLIGPKSAADSSLKVLGTQFAGAGTRTDARKGAALDLVIGDGFTKLTAPGTAKKALAALQQGPVESAKPKC